MSFAGLKQRAAAQDRVIAQGLVDHAEARLDEAIAKNKRDLLVLVMEESRDCRAPKATQGLLGFVTRWNPLTRDDLRGRALIAYDLLLQKREALPEDDRFDIVLRAEPIGIGHLVGWSLEIWIEW